ISAVPRALEASFSGDERRRLRLLARRTWRFFEAFVGPRDQWLPIDNYQEAPHQQTAHRTSPTNIGLSMLATLSAYDLGYLGPSELSLRLRRAFESIARLAHHEGHLLNWYDTQSLQPLLPRYVSTVDSGNFAGCLVALRQGCQELTRAPVVRAASWEGLLDSLELLAQTVSSLPAAGALREVISGMQDSAQHAREHLEDSLQVLRRLSEASSLELERELLALLGSGALRHEVELLHSLRTSSAALHLLVEQLRRELEALAPWLVLGEDATACGLVLPTGLCLDEIPDACQRLLGELAAPGEPAAPGDPAAPAPARLEACAASAQRLTEAFTKAAANATALVAELGALAALAGEEVRGMDFGMLYDRERRLFHIGHNVTSDQVDPNHYDLLASEARLTSFLAIVKRDVPEAHWVALGRPLTPVGGAPALLSWGGTMFEYLMPELLMRSQPETLLARTTALAVDAQIAYGAQTKAPWGISESAYARLDAGETYQYQSFGVPGLGLRRGLEEDQVISPYSCLLALAIRPRAVLDNLRDLEARGMLGPYGFFEALDLTPERQTGEGEGSSRGVVVRSYMAHHQGMILVSLGNLLAGRSMVERFHADPMIEAGEVLLNEQAPEVAPKEWPRTQHAKIETAAPGEALAPLPASWSAAALGGAQAFALGNGQLTSLVTGSGGGGLRWRGLALTRYQPDATSDDDGLWIYLRDEDSGQIWLATSQRGQTTYSMHKVEHHLRSQGISIHVEVAVAASDDVEVRHVTLHNETAARRRLTVTSAGRPVLFDAAGASSHPMFSSLFVNSEWEPALEALVFSRRAQSDKEEPAVLVHRLVCEGPSVLFAGYQTERGAFLGRGGSLRAPRALEEPGGLRGQVGAVLDPVMCLMAEVTLEPKSSVTLAFVTAVASE
ncbi:MAG TPA: glucoamylase family protein, partial [Kofleriaceae bacterium]|nr:glucoamylase family protein [Kofleriaceae bacterium]